MYQLTQGATVVRLSDGVVIPEDKQNTDWQQYLAWLASGGVPIAAPQVLTKTTVVTMRQAQLALLADGLLDKVDAAVAQAPRAVQVTWATAGTVERTNPLIASLQPSLGLTDEQVDALFAQAAAL